jgi:hypothetical protein
MFRAREVGSALHVLTITPFFPSDQNEVSGCFVAEPIEQLKQLGVDCSVIAAAPDLLSSKTVEFIGDGRLGAISASSRKSRALECGEVALRSSAGTSAEAARREAD